MLLVSEKITSEDIDEANTQNESKRNAYCNGTTFYFAHEIVSISFDHVNSVAIVQLK